MSVPTSKLPYIPAVIPADEAGRLRALHSYDILDTPVEAAFDELTKLASKICGMPIALVTLIDERRQWFKSRHGMEMTETPRDQAFCAHAILHNEPFIVRDSQQDPRFASNPLVTGESNVRFYAGVPLQNGDGHKVGTLCVIDHQPRELTADQTEALAVLAHQVVTLLEMRKLVSELAATASRATDSNSRLVAVLDAATAVGIIGMDPDGSITVFNAGAESLLGYQASEVLGKSVALFHEGSELRARAGEVSLIFGHPVSPVQALLALARAGTFEEREWTLRKKDGSGLSAVLVISAARDDEGVVTGFVGVARDITDSKRAATAREELDKAKREFVSTVSHELRAPLTSIRGSLGLLAAGVAGQLPGEALHLVDVAERNSLRLIALINDILDFERLDHGQLEMEQESHEIAPLLRRAAESVKALADQQGMEISITAGEERVRADAHRIVQVLVNLLSNAIKFSPKNSTINVTAARTENGFVEVRVQDRGRGVPPALQEKIFERFQQVDASDAKTKGGTGLGLAIARAIIEQHGGTLGVSSEGEGGGSTFWFRIPPGQ